MHLRHVIFYFKLYYNLPQKFNIVNIFFKNEK